MANPSGNHNQEAATTHHASASFNGGSGAGNNNNNNPNNGNSVTESSSTVLKHNPGISTDWSAEEQAVLEDGLNNFSTESNIIRYAKIAMQLNNKTVRDVALRCRWMTKKEFCKRRKEDTLARKNKDKKERVTDPSAKASHFMAHPNVPPYGTSMVLPRDYDDGTSYKSIGGATGELFDQNEQIFRKVTANFAALQVLDQPQDRNALMKENIPLLIQARENIIRAINEMNERPKIMKQMPPLPVKINEELADAVLGPPKVPYPVLRH